MAAADCAKVAYDAGLRKVKVYVKGPGAGRESAIRTIHGSGIEVMEIIDVTPLPHNEVAVLLTVAGYKRQEERNIRQRNLQLGKWRRPVGIGFREARYA